MSIRISILGGSGYTAGEIIRLVVNHPQLQLDQVVSLSQSGQPLWKSHPHLRSLDLPKFISIDALTHTDILILAQPHGISQNKIEVHGSIQLRDINKRLGINLSDSSVTTINGYILEALQEIPQAGMTFKEDNIIIEVEKVNNNYVEKATITNNG